MQWFYMNQMSAVCGMININLSIDNFSYQVMPKHSISSNGILCMLGIWYYLLFQMLCIWCFTCSLTLKSWYVTAWGKREYLFCFSIFMWIIYPLQLVLDCKLACLFTIWYNAEKVQKDTSSVISQKFSCRIFLVSLGDFQKIFVFWIISIAFCIESSITAGLLIHGWGHIWCLLALICGKGADCFRMSHLLCAT